MYSFGSRLFVGKNKYAYFIACNKVIILGYSNQNQTQTQIRWVLAKGSQSMYIRVWYVCTVRRAHALPYKSYNTMWCDAMRCDAYTLG